MTDVTYSEEDIETALEAATSARANLSGFLDQYSYAGSPDTLSALALVSIARSLDLIVMAATQE